jgi:hypothetical protein
MRFRRARADDVERLRLFVCAGNPRRTCEVGVEQLIQTSVVRALDEGDDAAGEIVVVDLPGHPVAGLAMIGPRTSTLWGLYIVAITRDQQGTCVTLGDRTVRLADALLAGAIQVAVEGGAETVIGLVHNENAKAMRVLERNGFIVSRRGELHEPALDVRELMPRAP